VRVVALAPVPNEPVRPARQSFWLVAGRAALVLIGGYFPTTIVLGWNVRSMPDVPWSAVLIGLYLWWLARRMVSADEPGHALQSMIGGVGALAACMAATGLYLFVFPVVSTPLPMLQNFGWILQTIYAATIALISAVVEEVAFRGLALSYFLTRMKAFAAIGLSSALFCLWHYDNPSFAHLTPAYFLLGVAFGFVYLQSRSLRVVIALHFLMDLILLLAVRQPISTRPEAGAGYLLALAIALVAGLAIAYYFLGRSRACLSRTG
jgi:membrane protease YdiL (CAAX protease family)